MPPRSWRVEGPPEPLGRERPGRELEGGREEGEENSGGRGLATAALGEEP